MKLVVDVEVYGTAQEVEQGAEAALSALAGAPVMASGHLPAEEGWVWSASFEVALRSEQLHAWNVLRSALSAGPCGARVSMHDCREGESCRNETYREWRKGDEGGR